MHHQALQPLIAFHITKMRKQLYKYIAYLFVMPKIKKNRKTKSTTYCCFDKQIICRLSIIITNIISLAAINILFVQRDIDDETHSIYTNTHIKYCCLFDLVALHFNLSRDDVKRRMVKPFLSSFFCMDECHFYCLPIYI